MYQPHRFEQRIASYWVDAAAGALRAGQLHPPDRPAPAGRRRPGRGGWGATRRCRGRCATRRCRSGSAARRSRRSPRPASSASTRSTSRIAATTGRRRRAFFAEKSNLRARRPARRAVPGCAASCSWCATSATWCARSSRSTRSAACSGFGRAEAGSDAELRRVAGRLGDRARPRVGAPARTHAHLVRYEDLVLDPERTLAGLLDHLGVDSGTRDRRGACWARSRRTCPSCATTRPATAPQASIGRWRTDLDPELAEACERAFGAGAGAVRLRAARNEPASAHRHQSRGAHTAETSL